MAMQYLTDRVHGKPVQMIQGDLNRPVAINLQWGGPNPQWAMRDVTPADPARLLGQILEPESAAINPLTEGD